MSSRAHNVHRLAFHRSAAPASIRLKPEQLNHSRDRRRTEDREERRKKMG